MDGARTEGSEPITPTTEPPAKVALVTGGSGGIGAAIARDLARDGWDVAIGYRNGQESAEATLVAITTSGGRGMTVQLDVADESAISAAFSAISETLGPVSGLVNNAGMTRDGLTVKYPTDAFEEVLSVNLTGTFRCSRAALRGMMRARWGRIVNMSSVVALRGNPGQAAYSASKAGIIGLTRSLCREVGSRGITVNAVAPGLVDTEMVADLTEEHRDMMVANTPVGRAATPEDVSAVVRFLMSDEASYLTGVVIPVDGGLSA
jgi:3-oxoacyl-[acyl-carrier protein] reductase